MFLTSLRGAGYWWALAANLIVQSAILFGIIQCTDWEKQVELALIRAGITRPLEDFEDESQPLLEKQRRTSLPAPSGRGVVSSVSIRGRTDSELTSGVRWMEIIFYRTIIALILVCVLASGIFVRITINQPEWPTPLNSTISFNTSQTTYAVTTILTTIL